MDMVGKSFGGWMQANASNPDYAVNVGGQLYTLSNAPDSAIRQAVAAKMASSYIKPYSGMNKSFLGKYLFPGMQRGMSSAISSAAASNAKIMRANRLDAAVTAFRGSPSPEGMLELDRVLRLDGYDNKTIRGHITSELTKVQSDQDFEILMNTPYGPNGKPFQEQYPQEAAELRVSREQLQQRGVEAAEMDRSTQDREALDEAKNLIADDYAKDGELNANPERLTELANKARAAGNIKTAEFWEGQIADTAYMKNSEQVKKQYQMQMQAGIIPSDEEILQNPALSMKDKQSLLGTAKSSGGQEPTTELAKGHKEEIDAAIKQRGGFTQSGKRDPSVVGMKNRAWREYKAVYARELAANGGNTEAAAEAAMSDFKAKFGEDKYKGQYALNSGDAGANKAFKYKNYETGGELSTTSDALGQIEEKFTYMDPNVAINTAPDLFEGEEKALVDMQRSFTTTGRVGTVPKAYYQLQQMAGGNVSIMDLINKRLNANGLEPLPTELNEIIKPVENTFDEETYKYVSYKPNTTRTDIGLISSGQEPVYRTSLPIDVASDQEFQFAVRDTAQRLGVSEADLLAVMSFETGGSFNPGIRNAAGSGATGLIQFMPNTAAGLGTSTQALAGMSRAQQMHYVERYLSNKGVKGKGLSDLYMAVLFPAAVGKPDNFVLFGKGAMSGYTGRAYQQNKGLDKNGDGSVTKAEASAKVLRHRHANPWRRPNNMRPELQ